ncbi:hypothetical protein, partial [Cronobacter dublinensis]|uniref:hypothetical protein n=1 Tax=Cronobacter dublinensis TaxID=413497 RepID=UPI001F1B721F
DPLTGWSVSSNNHKYAGRATRFPFLGINNVAILTPLNFNDSIFFVVIAQKAKIRIARYLKYYL